MIFGLLAVHTLGMSAAGQDLESAIEFVRQAQVHAREFPDVGSSELAIYTTSWTIASEGDLARIKKEVDADPNHPFASSVQEILTTKRVPKEEVWTLWIRDARNWRWNSDRVDQRESSMSDIVMRDGWAWLSSPRELALFDPATGFPPGRNIAEAHQFFSRPLATLVHGVPPSLCSAEIDPDRCEMQGEIVTVRFRGSDSTISLRWWSTPQRWVTTTALIPREMSESRFDFDGWRTDPVLGTCVSNLSIYDGAGQLRTRYEVGSTATALPDHFESITRVPDPTIGDAVRGTQPEWAQGSRIAVVRDYRASSSKPTVSALSPPESVSLSSLGGGYPAWVVPALAAIAVIASALAIYFKLNHRLAAPRG